MSVKSIVSCKELMAELEKSKHGLFSTRDTPEEAIEFAKEMGKQHGMKEIDVLAMLLVYHNTLLNQIIKSLK